MKMELYVVKFARGEDTLYVAKTEDATFHTSREPLYMSKEWATETVKQCDAFDWLNRAQIEKVVR